MSKEFVDMINSLPEGIANRVEGVKLIKRKGKSYRVTKWKLVKFSWVRGLAVLHFSWGKLSGFKDPEYYGHDEILTITCLIFRWEFMRCVMPLG